MSRDEACSLRSRRQGLADGCDCRRWHHGICFGTIRKMKASPHGSQLASRRAARTRPKYQPLPDLSPDEFELLKQDVAEHGIQIPVIQDEHGNTLDGHQRERAAIELQLKNYPV